MIFPLLEIIGKKKFNYKEKRKKNWCRNLEISYCMICIMRLYCGEQWQRQGAGLGIRRAQGRWGTGARAGALGVLALGTQAGRVGVQAAWALGRWAARAQERGALERAGARQQALGSRLGFAWTGAERADGRAGRAHGRRAVAALGRRRSGRAAGARESGRRAGRAQQARGRRAA